MYHRKISLLDILAFIAEGCYLSDLCYLYTNQEQRRQLADILMDIPSGSFSLSEWNDALAYLTGVSGMNTIEQAKGTLIECLRT